MPDWKSYKYLAVKNWSTRQKQLLKRAPAAYIQDATDKDSHPEYSRLSPIERYVLDGCQRLRGRFGRNLDADSTWILRALCVAPAHRGRCAHAIPTLVARGFLIPSNDKFDVSEHPLEEKSRGEESKEEIIQQDQQASPGSSPESETKRPPVDVEPEAAPTTPDLPVYERAEDVPDFDKPRCLASRLWVCLDKPKHHEPKLRVWANDLRPSLEHFEFLEMWQAMKWATHEDTFWSGVIKGAANWAKNVEKIMDAYHAHLRGKANFERMQKQKAGSKTSLKKAPANYGNGKIELEGTIEL